MPKDLERQITGERLTEVSITKVPFDEPTLAVNRALGGVSLLISSSAATLAMLVDPFMLAILGVNLLPIGFFIINMGTNGVDLAKQRKLLGQHNNDILYELLEKYYYSDTLTRASIKRTKIYNLNKKEKE